VEDKALNKLPKEISNIPASGNPVTEAGKQAIFDCIQACCNSTLSEALSIQAKHSAGFMGGAHCKKGKIGSEFKKTMSI